MTGEALKTLPKARFTYHEEQDSGLVYGCTIEIREDTFIVDVCDNPREPGPYICLPVQTSTALAMAMFASSWLQRLLGYVLSPRYFQLLVGTLTRGLGPEPRSAFLVEAQIFLAYGDTVNVPRIPAAQKFILDIF